MLKLPIECLFEILKHLKKDRRSLFSCLLVNRQLCRTVIPILWSRIEISKNKKLINICLSALNAEEKALLIPCGIAIPNNIKLLFEYLTYTTHIQMDSIDGIKEVLLESHYLDEFHNCSRYLENFPASVHNAAQAIRYTLIKMFLRISKKLKQLDILGNALSYCPFGLVSFNPLDVDEVQILVKAFYKNTTLTSLTIKYIPLNSEAGKAFAEFMRGNTTITRLSLANNQLNTEGGRALAEALYNNTTLTRLSLANNQLNAEGGRILAEALYYNTTLSHLSLRSNQLGIEGAKALARVLYKNTSITYLNLKRNQLGSEGVRVLANALCKNTAISSLNLSYNQIRPEGGKALADALCKNTAVTLLNLNCNQIGSEGGKALAAALYKNTTLRSLILCYNQLNSEVGKTLTEALYKNTSLTSLELTKATICSRYRYRNYRRNRIDIDTLNRITELLKRNESNFNIR